MKQLILTLAVLLFHSLANAQDTVTNATRTPTGMYAHNKIYVVMAVAITILIGLFLYVIRLDKKISKLEKESSL